MGSVLEREVAVYLARRGVVDVMSGDSFISHQAVLCVLGRDFHYGRLVRPRILDELRTGGVLVKVDRSTWKVPAAVVAAACGAVE